MPSRVPIVCLILAAFTLTAQANEESSSSVNNAQNANAAVKPQTLAIAVKSSSIATTGEINPTPTIVGETYPFAEADLLDQIQKHIEANKEAIEARLKEKQSQAREQINSYKPKDLTYPLPRATENRTFEPDMTYIVPEDVKDARGVVVYPKGYKFNPIDYVWLKTSYVVIDALDREQIEWLKQSGFLNKVQYQVWLSNGSWSETSKELNQSVYYVNQAIADRFQLKAVPSIIRQSIDPKTSYSVIKVGEVCIDCNGSIAVKEEKEKR